MSRFVFITDTHLGASPMGYQQQRGYPEHLEELVRRLDEWIVGEGDIEFVLHGGDMVDGCHQNLLLAAAARFRFSVPCYLCLGNHDLTGPEAAPRWVRLAPGFFPGGAPQFEIVGQSVVHVVPNHWDEYPYHWDQVQQPYLGQEQISRLSEVIATYPNRAHILCTHSPLFGIPPAQTGLSEPYHDPGPAFRASVLALRERHPQIRCVLTGHNHINSITRGQNALYVSASAFVEVPFEFKVIEVEEGRQTSIRTQYLLDKVSFRATYDYDKAFVQGRACDRHATL